MSEENSIEVEQVLDDVIIVISEAELLNLIREVAGPDRDADLIYMEFWANSRLCHVIDDVDECDCCDCDMEAEDFNPDLCECECICEYITEEEESEIATEEE